MSNYNKNYDPGFVVSQGRGQSVTNPMPAVFFDSMGIVKDLSVYGDIYGSRNINAKDSVIALKSFIVGNSFISTSFATFDTPSTFTKDVSFQSNIQVANTLTVSNLTNTQRLIVNGKEYVETVIVALNGTFKVLATV